MVAVNGPALGLGASILPLCDVVWASERAWFQTPCAALRLTPSACSSYTFPQILGVALVRNTLQMSPVGLKGNIFVVGLFTLKRSQFGSKKISLDEIFLL